MRSQQPASADQISHDNYTLWFQNANSRKKRTDKDEEGRSFTSIVSRNIYTLYLLYLNHEGYLVRFI